MNDKSKIVHKDTWEKEISDKLYGGRVVGFGRVMEEGVSLFVETMPEGELIEVAIFSGTIGTDFALVP